MRPTAAQTAGAARLPALLHHRLGHLVNSGSPAIPFPEQRPDRHERGIVHIGRGALREALRDGLSSALLRVGAFLEEPGLVYEHNRLHTVAEAELLEDVRDVCLDGRLADVELLTDLCVAPASGAGATHATGRGDRDPGVKECGWEAAARGVVCPGAYRAAGFLPARRCGHRRSRAGWLHQHAPGRRTVRRQPSWNILCAVAHGAPAR